MLSFFRKLSIGGKIKDGMLPEEVMGTAEDILKNQSSLVLKTDTELKECVYGKLRSICVLYHSTFRALSDNERWCDIASDICSLPLSKFILLISWNVEKCQISIILSRKFCASDNFASAIFSDILRTIKDPEKPQTLEQLDVVYEDCINICANTPRGISVIRVEFNPTVPHCSLATLIGLCIRVKLERFLVASFKLDIYIKKGAHSTEEESIYIYI